MPPKGYVQQIAHFITSSWGLDAEGVVTRVYSSRSRESRRASDSVLAAKREELCEFEREFSRTYASSLHLWTIPASGPSGRVRAIHVTAGSCDHHSPCYDFEVVVRQRLLKSAS